jgi:hypothetical protein
MPGCFSLASIPPPESGAKMERRLAQIDQSVAQYLSQLDTADLQEPSEGR